MRRVLTVIAVVACLGLAECGPTTYQKAGATSADFERDKLECDYEAKSRLPDGNPLFYSEMFHQCLQIKGWRPAQ